MTLRKGAATRRPRLFLWLLAGFSIVLATVAFTHNLRSYHPTPVDALHEFPGYLWRPLVPGSFELLQQEEISGGLVLLYRWQEPEQTASGAFHLGRTFVTPVRVGLRNGWRAQASGSTEVPTGDGLVAVCTVGGNITPLTTAFGSSRQGEAVRIVWGDGQAVTVPLNEGSFVHSRPSVLSIERFDLLGAQDQVLASQVQ